MQSLDFKGKIKLIKEKLNINKKQPNYYNSFFLMSGEKRAKENLFNYMFV